VEYLKKRIRQKTKDEIQDAIRTSLGEYIDEEEPASNWDVGGLLKWASRKFNVNATQNQLRKMTPIEIEELLISAANDHYDQLDLSPIEAYMDPQYGRRALADWARNKFNIDLTSEEVAEGSTDNVANVIFDKVNEAYKRRELVYPVESAMERAFGSAGTDNVYALQYLARWANSKYNLDWTAERFSDKSPKAIADELVAAGRDFVEGGRLETEVDQALQQYGHNGELTEWAKQRFGKALDLEALNDSENDQRQVLLEAGRQVARWELTQLERYVLLRIYDQGWKDHLLEMDHLKSAIMQRPMGGDQTHPQSQFAIEGREQFEQMWKTIRNRVTDTIFKISGGVEQATTTDNRMTRMQTQHAEATNAGLAGGDESQKAAMQAQGEEGGKTTRIVRDQPKVGRNDPCPCGSGKKYKQCHGKNP
jgi:preprotein translocase subunit SecA